MPVTCKIEVADSGNGDIPPRTWSWTVDANEDGSLIINVPDRGEGNLSLKLDAVGKDKARYGGKKDMSFDDLRTMQQSVSWTVERRPLSLELFFKWDEKFSREAFRPDVGGAIFSHVVVVSGPDRHETIMDGKGCARFYGLKSGEYAVGLTDAGKAMYSVKEASKSVTIPTKGDGPVKAEVSLAPVKVIQLSGRVVDATDGLPVANAILLAGNSAAKAGKDGKFSFRESLATDLR